MDILISELLLLFILIVVSDGVAAVMAGRSLLRIRHRAPLALPFALVMFAFSLEALNNIINTTVNGNKNPNTVFVVQAIIGRAVKSAATWYLALKLMNGYSKQHREDNHETTTSNTSDPGATGSSDS